ncbi:hypothetical protein [uncultured Oscillibacter sp.]|uniref:hypothetical protein n=1 Tax=uncultured Oscillibacter sp. TaxID=876091 RepID=UPI0025DEDD75|nr:hypothetical protein [uncultured Oscillibacter sp.]
MDYKTEPKQQEPQLICLCAACASAFYNVPTIRIKRADRYQFVKDTCTYCGIRSGYESIIDRTYVCLKLIDMLYKKGLVNEATYLNVKQTYPQK